MGVGAVVSLERGTCEGFPRASRMPSRCAMGLVISVHPSFPACQPGQHRDFSMHRSRAGRHLCMFDRSEVPVTKTAAHESRTGLAGDLSRNMRILCNEGTCCPCRPNAGAPAAPVSRIALA